MESRIPQEELNNHLWNAAVLLRTYIDAEFFPGTVRHKDVTGACPKRKPPRCMSDGGEKTYLLDHLGWRDIPLSSRAMPVCTGCLWQRIRA